MHFFLKLYTYTLHNDTGCVQVAIQYSKFDNSNLLFSVTAELCAEYEHLAFLAGLRLGAYLITEMLQAES